MELKEKLDQTSLVYEETVTTYEKNTLNWYRKEGREKLGPSLPAETHVLSERSAKLSAEETGVQASLASSAQKEYEVVQAQLEFLDHKLEALEKRTSRLKDSDLQSVLDSELKRTSGLKDSLTQESSLLETALKK